MTQEDWQRIDGIQAQLREQIQRTGRPLSYLRGEDGYFDLCGNDAAFLQLAIDSLEAARAREVTYTLPYENTGYPAYFQLRFDPNPKAIELKKQPWWAKPLIFAITSSFAVVLLAGLETTASWIYRHVVRFTGH